ncbi:DMT family transporter [Gordonia polyisoprenivorans]|uniref:DMT family transporter n=1 Tax=Gordonia polyisoprenivorans TaxID=84595 RepID=UPI0030D1D5DE
MLRAHTARALHATPAAVLLVAAILTEVSASMSLPIAAHHPALYGVVAVGFAGSFAFLTLALRRGMLLGVAYGVWGASGVAATAMASALIYGERLTAPKLWGLALVVVGVLAIELGARRGDEAR